MADDTRINWQDYYGLNQGAYQQQAQGLTDELGAQDAAVRRDVGASARGAYQRGVMGQPGVDWQLNRGQQGLMSYGDAVEALQNPSNLQAALEKSGHRPVSALDAAGTQQAAGDSFRQATNRYKDTDAYARQTTERAAQDYARGQSDEARLAQQRKDAVEASQRAAAAEKERRAAWQQHLEDSEAGRGRLKFNGGRLLGPNAEVDASGAQDRADARNLTGLFQGTMSEGNVSDRLRQLYHRARNPLARYGVKGNY